TAQNTEGKQHTVRPRRQRRIPAALYAQFPRSVLFRNRRAAWIQGLWRDQCPHPPDRPVAGHAGPARSQLLASRLRLREAWSPGNTWPMLTLRQIEVIRAIMVTGTVGGAARLLNVSSPGISRVMKHAELSVGVKLFNRRGGRYTPTSEANAI